MRHWAIPTVLLLLAAVTTVEAGTLERVRQTGVFKIGYRADAKPYSYRGAQGQPAGYIVDLCTEVAGQFGRDVRTQYVVVSAEQRFEAVRDGRVDILCDPSSVTLARREMVDFSLPTFLDGASVLSRTSKPVQRFEELAGKRVGVLTGTTSEQVLRKSLGELGMSATIVAVPDHREGIDLLSDAKLDAYFADRAIIAALLNEGGRPGLQLSNRYFSYETYALALPRDDGEFRLMVDRTLARLYRTGKIDAILARTFGKAPPDDMLKAMFLINSLPDK